MKTLPSAAVLVCVGMFGLSFRPDLLAAPKPGSVSPTQVQAEGCSCLTGEPCTCPVCRCAEAAGVAEAIADLSARLEALEAAEQLAVVPEPPPIMPERTVDEIMSDLQLAHDEVAPDPVDVPLTHDGGGYLTTAAIREWLREKSGGGGWSYGGGDYGAPLRNHLIRTHGWRESQLIGLSDSELRELHSADHNGRLGPKSDVSVTLALVSASDEGVPVYFDTTDDYWHWEWANRNYRWHTLEEGKTYGGRFVYHDGRMCWNGEAIEEAPPAPVARAVYVAPVRISSSGGCPNGRCPLPSSNYRRRGRW